MDNSLLLALMVQGAAMRVAIMETGAPYDRALDAATKALDLNKPLPDDFHEALRHLEDLAHAAILELDDEDDEHW